MNLEGNEQWMSRANNYIEDDVRKRLRAKAFPTGSIIFPKIGAAIATNKKRILSVPACVDNNVMAVTARDALSSIFLYALFKEKNISEFAQPGNPPSMRKGDVESWAIPIPPLELQRRFAALLAEIEKVKSHHRAHLAKLNALFASLQHRAFRGEL
jgi:type I restriction enzyme S subunit